MLMRRGVSYESCSTFRLVNGESLKHQVRCDGGDSWDRSKNQFTCMTPPGLVLGFAFVLGQSQRLKNAAVYRCVFTFEGKLASIYT